VFVNRWLERESIGWSSSRGRAPSRATLVAGGLDDWRAWAPLAAAYREVGPFWSLDWTGHRPWVRALQPRVDVLHDGFWEMVRRLHDGGLLTGEEARAVEPSIRVDVHDARRDTRRALPPVPAPTRGNPWRRPPPVRPDRPV
jgi:hypothetical protein